MRIRLTVKAQRQHVQVCKKKFGTLPWHAAYVNPPNSQGTMSKRASEKKTQNQKCDTLPMPLRLTVKAQRQTLRVQKKTFGTHSMQIRLTVKAQCEHARLRKKRMRQPLNKM